MSWSMKWDMKWFQSEQGPEIKFTDVREKFHKEKQKIW